MAERYDVVIFGATGYTGKYVVREGVKILKNLRWAVAGRNSQKLKDTLKEVGGKVGTDLTKIPTIIADIKDESSLKAMTAQAKVIINCCGPYRLYGEQVIEACIETRTSHVDVSGEPQFMETMQLKYNEAAREKRVYIVSACGFDSIPADLGTIFMQKNFNGTLNSVETYLKASSDINKKMSGSGIHYGTYESAVYGLAHANELSGIRQQLFPTRLPKFSPALKEKSVLHRFNSLWCVPFLGSDRSIVYRSQRYLFEKRNQRPVQMRAYMAFNTFLEILGLSIFGLIFAVLVRFNFGRKLLLRHPKFFTFNFVSHEGPTEEYNENAVTEMHFYGKGWKETVSGPTDEINLPLNKSMHSRIVMKNPGYGFTAITLLLAAVTILNDKANLPEAGVHTPGIAFMNTNFIEELDNCGFRFEILDDKES